MHRRTIIVFVTVLAVVSLSAALTLWARHDRPSAPSAAPSPTASVTVSAAPTRSPLASGSVESPAPSGTSTTTPAPSPTGQPGLPSGLVGKDLEVMPTSRSVVALTFDAGANADGLNTILTTLADRRVTATFFITGQFAAEHPAQMRAIVAGGHRLGNHSMTHPHMTAMSNAQIRGELDRAFTAIRAAGGTDPRPFFRFPFGDRNARTITTVNANGYAAVRWTVDTLGWKGTSGGSTVQSVLDRALSAARPGEIVLMHVGSNPDDGTTLDALALAPMIDQLRARHYSFTTLDALL